MRQRSLRVKLFIVCCDEVSVCARVLSIARLTAADLFGAAFAEISNNSTGRMRLKSGKALRGAVSPQHEEKVPGSGMERRKGGESGQKKSPRRLASAGTQESGVGNGTRTHDNRNHNPGLYQLSYSHQNSNFVACPAGIEPATTCLEGRCSIQLSYGQIDWCPCMSGNWSG